MLEQECRHAHLLPVTGNSQRRRSSHARPEWAALDCALCARSGSRAYVQTPGQCTQACTSSDTNSDEAYKETHEGTHVVDRPEAELKVIRRI